MEIPEGRGMVEDNAPTIANTVAQMETTVLMTGNHAYHGMLYTSLMFFYINKVYNYIFFC